MAELAEVPIQGLVDEIKRRYAAGNGAGKPLWWPLVMAHIGIGPDGEHLETTPPFMGAEPPETVEEWLAGNAD